jgi:hypothetical protein
MLLSVFLRGLLYIVPFNMMRWLPLNTKKKERTKVETKKEKRKRNIPVFIYL